MKQSQMKWKNPYRFSSFTYTNIVTSFERKKEGANLLREVGVVP
jgi:hypothetical protein